MQHYLPVLLRALPATFEMLFISVLAALVLGFFLAWGKISKNPFARTFSSVFISFMRGTPMMVQILLIFILVPMYAYSHGIDTGAWDPIVYAIVSFSLNEAAFFAEIFRSAYASLDYGQIEAAQSLGMSRIQVFGRVILPQAAARALPNTTNMTLELMKNTSIASVIGVYDILGKAQQMAKNSYGVGQFELYIEVALIFWIIGLIILTGSNAVTARMNRGNASYKKVSIFALHSQEEQVCLK